MSRTMSTFLRDESGGAMILAAVILPIGLAAVGAAVTYSNVSATRVSYQKALDGAVLAGTILPGSASVAERIKTAEVVFAAGITGQVQSVTVASSTRFKVDTVTLCTWPVMPAAKTTSAALMRSATLAEPGRIVPARTAPSSAF